MNINLLSDLIVVDYLSKKDTIFKEQYAKLLWELLGAIDGTVDPDKPLSSISEAHIKYQTALGDLFTIMLESGEADREEIAEIIALSAHCIEEGDLEPVLSDEVFEQAFDVMMAKENEKGWRLWPGELKQQLSIN